MPALPTIYRPGSSAMWYGLFNQRQQRLGVLGDGQRLIRLLVIDAIPAAQVEPFDLVAAGGEPLDQLIRLGHRLDVRPDLVDGRADVQVQRRPCAGSSDRDTARRRARPARCPRRTWFPFFPVVVFTCVLGSTSGLIRSAPIAFLPASPATRSTFSISASLSMLNAAMPTSAPREFPHQSLPTPA